MVQNYNEYLNYTLPKNWCAEEEMDNLLLYNPNGNGAITISFFNVLNTEKSLDEQIRNQNSRLYRTKEFIEVLEESNELIIDFSTALWCSLLEEIIVYEDYVTVKFRGGIDIEVREEEYN